MSGDSTHGAALCALAAAVAVRSATAAITVFIERPCILHAPGNRTDFSLNKSRTAFTGQYYASRSRDFVISRSKLRGYLPLLTGADHRGHEDIRMKHLLKACCWIGLSVPVLAPAASADEFRLS